MTRDLRVPIDTLKYTRRGLETREAIPLEVGTHNRVVLVRPARARAVRASGSGFAPGKSFPLPGTLLTFWRAKKPETRFTYHHDQDPCWNGSAAQLWAHCSSDDATDKKQLSDRRARVGKALLLSDPAGFHEVANEEAWGDTELQSMLRTLGCDPGPADGMAERLTQDAATEFARRYNKGVYHVGGERPEPVSEGQIDEELHRAVREAFIFAHGVGIAPESVHPVHPAHGCSAFNRASLTESRNRRLTIVNHASVPPYPESAPCTAGDEQSCAVVDDEPYSCMWFREHVTELAPAGAELFDPRWLWIRDDRYVLSALTTADDGEAVCFEVSDAGDDTVQAESLDGIVRGGVAAVVWASSRAPEAPDGTPPHLVRPRFTVRHPASPDSQAHANWPELRTLELIQLSDDHDELRARTGGVRVVGDDGSYEHFTPFAEAVSRSPRHVVLSFPDVPSNLRVHTWLEAGNIQLPLMDGARIEEIDGACRAGEQCEELSPAPPPPSYNLDDVELDWTASVGVAEVHEEVEPTGEAFDE